MAVSTAVWLFFASIAYNSVKQEDAEFFMRLSYVGVAFIAITMFHLTTAFLKLKLRSWILPLTYLYGTLSSFLILKTNYLIKGTYKYFWGYYPRAGEFHPIFLVIFIFIVVMCVVLLLISFLKEKESVMRKRQIGYLLLALFIYDFASVDFIPNYGIEFYPFGYIPDRKSTRLNSSH